MNSRKAVRNALAVDGANAEVNLKMTEELGQYRLHDFGDADPVSGVEEVNTLLTPGPSMAEGTEQLKISDIETTSHNPAYIGETQQPDYDQLKQSKLKVDVPIETVQAEITDYNSRTGLASD